MNKASAASVLRLLLVVPVAVAQVGTAFTYQGRLTDAGTPPTGSYDLQFKLYDSGGSPVGSPITKSGVAVSNGLFTVSLDFGAGIFNGNKRFLEIAVSPAQRVGGTCGPGSRRS